MTRIPLKIPPGLFRNGTIYQAKGRWYDASLMRCHESTVRPVGGWSELTALGQGNADLNADFLDRFTGTAANLDTHTADQPADTWEDADDAFALDGSGAAIAQVTDGAVHYAYVVEDLPTPAVGTSWFWEVALGTVGTVQSGWGIVFLKSTSDLSVFYLRLFPTAHAGNTGWDFFNGILFNSHNAAGANEPVYSNILSATPNLPADTTYRFGVTVATTTSIDFWWEPEGGGTRTVLATWTGNTQTLPNRVDADHCRMGIVAETEVDAAVVNWHLLGMHVSETAATEITLDGIPRALVGWRGLDGDQVLAVGTNTALYAQTVGVLYDITPEAFVPGNVDTQYTDTLLDPASGYGDGDYGAGLYGTADPAQQAVVPAAVWHLDTFGEYLVGCCAPNDGRLYFWPKDTAVIAQRMDGLGGVLTSDGTNVTAADTVTIGSVTYEFLASVSTTANKVLIGADAAETLTNLRDAIAADPTKAGVTFGLDTVVHPQVLPVSLTATQLRVLSKVGGTVTVATTESSTHLSWGNTTLVAGSGQTAPIQCRGVVVTPERFVFALGADGQARRVEWPSQESLTDWSPTETNTAGGFDLEGVGNIVAGRRAKGETLIWTDDDLHAARYIGGELVYSFEKIGSKCGLIAPGAVAMVDTKAIWMGNQQFHAYDGYVTNVASEVWDAVFRDFNYDQRQKVSAFTLSRFGEVWWVYPSASSSENDRAVIWNYRENHWMMTPFLRTCGTDAGALAYPVLGAPTTRAGVPAGKLFEHEQGFAYTDLAATDYPDTLLTPYIESGPLELGDGEDVMYVSQLVPDELTLGDAAVSLYTAFYPTEPSGTVPGTQEVLRGPFTVNKLTSVRFSARQVRVRLDQATGVDWRVGTFRLDVQPAGKR